MEKEGNLNAVDVGKFLMAVIVIAIHVHPFEGASSSPLLDLYKLLCSCAVPFFFLSTGYLLARKLNRAHETEEKKSAVSRSLRKTVRLYIFWTIIYFPLAIYDYCTNGKSVLIDTALYIRGLFFVGEHFNSWILWYLLSATYALIMIRFLIAKGKSSRYILCTGVVIFIIGTLMTYLVHYPSEMSSASQMLQKLIKYSFANGRITTAFLFIPAGMVLFDMDLSKRSALAMIAFGVAICLGGYWYTPFVGNVLTVVTAIGIFVFALNVHLTNSVEYLKMRTASMVLYFTHLWIWSIYCFAMYRTLKPMHYGWQEFIAVTIVTLVLSEIYIMRLQKKNAVAKK